MRLTVGPLPAGVYWRRRLVVLLAIVLVVSVVVFSCQGGADPVAGVAATAGATGTSGPATEPTGVQTSATAPVSGSDSPSPSATAFTLPVNNGTGPCADTELEITVLTSSVEYNQGSLAVFTLKIKNISTRTCNRDIGGATQEIQIREHGTQTVVWSSDDCGGDTTTHWDQTFAPGFQRTFDRNWNGHRTRTDSGRTCVESDSTRLPIGLTYDLVARLDQKFSTPVEIKISSSKA